MNSLFWQVALRELKVFWSSPRFWLTFFSVVVLFAITGPYQTADTMSFPQRLGFWFVLQAIAWSIAISCIIIVDIGLAVIVKSFFVRLLIAGFVSPIPMGIAIALFSSEKAYADLMVSDYGLSILNSVPLTLLFSLLTSMTMGTQFKQAEQGETSDTDVVDSVEAVSSGDISSASPNPTTIVSSPAPLLARLRPENRGKLLHIAVEDHYIHVTTSRGHELVLLRFSDALKEVGDTDGLQVHRSHWVARNFVEKVQRENGKLTLVLIDNRQIPVSRTYTEAVRTLFP